MDDTTERVVAEAALAVKYHTQIHERASKSSIPALVDEVEKHSTGGPSPIALDTDGVPYITIGD